MDETRGEDGESMRQTIVIAAARNGYSDAHDPDEMRWWRIKRNWRMESDRSERATSEVQ